jgi:hypothetical protein
MLVLTKVSQSHGIVALFLFSGLLDLGGDPGLFPLVGTRLSFFPGRRATF